MPTVLSLERAKEKMNLKRKSRASTPIMVNNNPSYMVESNSKTKPKKQRKKSISSVSRKRNFVQDTSTPTRGFSSKVATPTTQKKMAKKSRSNSRQNSIKKNTAKKIR
jgi:hypothetical protein